MADIKERIKKLGEYFIEMKVANTQDGDYIYVSASFPAEWMLDGRTKDKFNVDCEKENGVTYFWGDLSVGFDSVFDAVDYNIKVNKEAQEKVVLFNKKLDELKMIFSDESNDLDKLSTLEFVFKDTETPQASNLPFITEKKAGRVKKEEKK